VRSGSQDVVGARALALAVELAVAERAEESGRLEALRRRVLEGATALPGVFASGDVRSGATMQVASAVGEGATAALRIREYLEGVKAE